MDNEYFVIFGGGGVRGVSYCGAHKALIERNINFSGYSGSSIGAVYAGLLSVGYNYKEIFEIFLETGFELFIDINIDLRKDLAFSKGNRFFEWIKNLIELKFYGEKYKKGEMPPVKFKDLKKELVIFSVDLTNLKYKEFSKKLTPDEEVAQAIRASVSMPGLFIPKEYNNTLLADGDLLKSNPLWRISPTIKEYKGKIIEFRLEDDTAPKKINNTIEYINRVYNTICNFATEYIMETYKDKDNLNYIKITTPDISVADFLISKEKKQELYNIGYNAVARYFDDFLPQKEKKLKEKYIYILNYLDNLRKKIDKKDIFGAYLNMCEMFMFLCEEKRYIDYQIYNKILNFKEYFCNNYTSVNVLGFKKTNIKNREIISEMLLDIIKETTLKI